MDAKQSTILWNEQATGDWAKLHNEELHNLYPSA
jgi:hypothetical protein